MSPPNSRWPTRFALATLLTLLAVGLLGVATAQAEYRYHVQAELGEEATGPYPGGVALDDSNGNVLTVDSYSGKVNVLESTGPAPALIAHFGDGQLSSPFDVAVDQSNGDVYVSDAGNNRIVRYTSDGASPPTYTIDPSYTGPAHGSGTEDVGSFASPLAVDPLTGDLLVADTGNLRVERFDSSGAFVSSFNGSDSTAGAFTSLEDVTTDPSGDVYVVADGVVLPGLEGMEGARVERFGAGGTFAESIGAAGELDEARSLSFEPRFENLLVGIGGGQKINAQGFQENMQTEVRSFHEGSLTASLVVDTETAIPTGMASEGGPAGSTFLALLHPGYSRLQVVRAVFAPAVTIAAATGVTAESAHLSGTVNPGGEPGAEYRFEYRGAGETSWQSTAGEPAGTASSPEPVAADISGLLPNREYEVRLTASNEGVANTTLPIRFTTEAVPPLAETAAATEVGETSAVLNGNLDSKGSQTTYFFEYGPTSAYGSRVPAGAEAIAGSGRGNRLFSRSITGLQPGVTYHFRIVASNSAGTVAGVDRVFTTLPVGGAEPARAYEQVTPVDKEGGVLSPFYGYQIKTDGSAVSYISGPIGGAAASAPWQARSLSFRGSDDWHGGLDVDPPFAVGQDFVQLSTLGVSADFTHTFMATNRALTPGAVAGGLNLYVKDVRTGQTSLVASSQALNALRGFTGLSEVSSNKFLGGAPDYSWIVFASEAPLLAGVTHTAVYRWSENGGLQLLSRLPDGSVPDIETSLAGPEVIRSVSEDGDRVYFALRNNVTRENKGLYLREGGQTRAVSVPEGGGAVEPAELAGISDSGRYAVFGSPSQLTADAPTAPSPAGSWSMYRYDAVAETVQYLGSSAIVVDSFFPEAFTAVSEDGQAAYFVHGEETLVSWHGELKPVGNFRVGGGRGFISPNGRYLAFAYGEFGGEPGVFGELGEVYLFDAATGQLSCASCSPTGAKGVSRVVRAGRYVSNQVPQDVTDDGEVFFETDNRLVQGDVNGKTDVYAFRDGVRRLISPGSGAFDAHIVGISPGAHDVFFTTEEGLVSRDVDRSMDLYDARIGGGLAAQNASPRQACAGEACQGGAAVAPPLAPTGSEAVSGEPTGRKCGKGQRLRTAHGRKRCIKAGNKRGSQKSGKRTKAGKRTKGDRRHSR